MRKPTIQAKPKLNRPVIPAGATVVSTKVVSKADKNEEEKTTNKSQQPASNIDLGAIPLLTSAEDVNGFRAVQKPKVK
jgi:splicing factor 45